MLKSPFAIAIDGPVGVGKSTIARRLAAQLNVAYVDTGAMYRAVALYNSRMGNAAEDEAAVAASLPDISIIFAQDNAVLLNGEDITAAIRDQALADYTSTIAAYSAVREKLTAAQRALAADSCVVMDGRDIGSAVLPHAQVKIYLDADADIRARRRFDELRKQGVPADFFTILEETHTRDQRDITRRHAPLVQAPDAHYIDASYLSIEESVDKIMEYVKGI